MIKVWHRRCGKDLDDFAYIVDQMLERVGSYWHVFPYYTQGRKAVWEGFTSAGKRYIDHVPKELIKSMDKNQMTFELVNGSIFRIVGADNPDSMVGAGPVGAVFSEYSLIRPSAWGLVEPMLLENGGWARFNMTPRGENHAFDMLEAAKKDIAERGKKSPWFVSILTINDTGIITQEQIEDLRRNGRSEELIQQEYYCSFAGALEGAYYSRQMGKAAQEGRITSVPHDPSKQVFTFWDLGMNDPTCIWFVQDIRLFLILMLGTGARNEAICHLTWEQVDFEEGLIYLNPQGRKQTSKRRATVKLVPFVREVLEPMDKKTPFVLMWRGRGIDKAINGIRKAVGRAEMDRKVTAYSCRHTVARWLRKEGVSPWEVGSQLGHKMPAFNITEIYASASPDYLEKSAVAIEKLLRAAIPLDAPPIPSAR